MVMSEMLFALDVLPRSGKQKKDTKITKAKNGRVSDILDKNLRLTLNVRGWV